MTEIKRFDMRGNTWPSDDGSIVSYKDHAAIVAALQEQVRALAAESVTLKDAVMDRIKLHEEIRSKGTPPHTDFWHQSIWMADKKVEDALKNTTATDAALREIRAQGAIDARNALVVAGDGADIYAVVTDVAASIRAGEQP